MLYKSFTLLWLASVSGVGLTVDVNVSLTETADSGSPDIDTSYGVLGEQLAIILCYTIVVIWVDRVPPYQIYRVV